AAASGGYMLACAADEIYADPSSIVGSIGVVSRGFGFVGLIEKLGVERRLYTAGTSKGMLDPFRPENEDEIAHLKRLQGDIHDDFIALVRARRGDQLAEGEDALFSGLFWSGRRAEALGLIDGLGDVRSTLRARFGEKVQLRPVGPGRGGLLSRLFGRGRATLIEETEAHLETRALWARYGL
ncbi:MAG: S49 family peptidase, partial [Pseudomonadota bacterium]